MKVLVSGATGFVGQWLVRELAAAGHEATGFPPSADLDVADVAAVRALVERTKPDAIAHLAAVASGGEANRDPARAIRTNIGGTLAVARAAAALDPPPGLLVVSSAEVYAAPAATDPPLREDAPLGPRHSYGMLKLAQEAVAVAAVRDGDVALAIVRPFNHVGPGQPTTAAVPAFAERIAAVRRGDRDELPVGNVDVERDIGDVRDVVVAYRLLLEALSEGRLGRPAVTFNVATGRAVSLRWIVDELCRQAGVRPRIVRDPALSRADDPPRIAGDADLLRRTVGWQPRHDLAATLADVLAQHPG